MTIVEVEDIASPGFDWMSEYRQVERLLAEGKNDRVSPSIHALAKRYADSRYLHVLLGMICSLLKLPTESVRSFEAAINQKTAEPLPELESPATPVYLNNQLALPQPQRPSFLRASQNLAANLAALRAVDGELADEVEHASVSPDLDIIDLWGTLHLYGRARRQVVVIAQSFVEQIDPHLEKYSPIGIASVMSGQEVPFCLERQLQDFGLGRQRPVYLFDPEPANLRQQLSLADLSRWIRDGVLVMFSGRSAMGRIDRYFSSLRFMPPVIQAGNSTDLERKHERIRTILDPTEYRAQSEAYYQSGEFQNRLRGLAAGSILPRALVYTCRWTTFLQYCAKDFQTAFSQLGCPTLYIIENSDTETLTPKLTYRQLVDFKPDFIFCVSHARPSFMIPRELPVISYLQDWCGPILTINDFSKVISPQDLLVCMASDLVHHLTNRGLDSRQVLSMPIPADETIFYPLDGPTDADARFIADIGFVKHGDAYGGRVFENFLAEQLIPIDVPEVRDGLIRIFTDLYRASRAKDRRFYEDEMRAFVDGQLNPQTDEKFRRSVHQLVRQFTIMVFGYTWRYQFLEALDAAGLAPALYGNHWEKHPQFARYARGTAHRTTELNRVYNFNAINLNIHQHSTMHQRISECALAGGFMLNSDHASDCDAEPIRPYYEPDKEIVMFSTAADLVDKCRYYLAHPNERRQIAGNFHRRALAQHTVRVGAQTMLNKWREILKGTLQ